MTVCCQGGYGAKEVQKCKINGWAKAAFSISELRESGFFLKELKAEGFELRQLKEHYALRELRTCFSLSELYQAGFVTRALKDGGVRLPAEDRQPCPYACAVGLPWATCLARREYHAPCHSVAAVYGYRVSNANGYCGRILKGRRFHCR